MYIDRNDANGKRYLIEKIIQLASDIKCKFPELARGYRIGKSTRSLAKSIMEFDSDYEKFGLDLVEHGVQNALKGCKNYGLEGLMDVDEYELIAKQNNSLSGKASMIMYNLMQGRVIWEGELGDYAIARKKEYGSRWGADRLIARDLNEKFYSGLDFITKKQVNSFMTRARKKGLI